jgi:hypothetical protein
MPFITKDRRALIEANKLRHEDFVPGDLCYTYYKPMVDKWRINPSWTTADSLYRDVLRHNFTIEDAAAAQLAWQVFFQLYVMPYELKKRGENGDI